MSSDTYDLDQMSLFTGITKLISEQCPSIPADNRANVIIDAANMIVKTYQMTDHEYVQHNLHRSK